MQYFYTIYIPTFRKEMFSLKLNKQVAELFEELSLNYIDKDILSDDILRCCTEAERRDVLRKINVSS